MTHSQDRQIDISFVAERSPRRERLIADASGMLWEWRTDVRFLTAQESIEPTLAASRVVILVHGDDELDFDWECAREAIAAGCVIVSETSNGFAPLVPGVHFVMAPYENVVGHAVALAFDEMRRGTIAAAARSVELPSRSASPPVPASEPTKHGKFRRKKPAASGAPTTRCSRWSRS